MLRTSFQDAGADSGVLILAQGTVPHVRGLIHPEGVLLPAAIACGTAWLTMLCVIDLNPHVADVAGLLVIHHCGHDEGRRQRRRPPKSPTGERMLIAAAPTRVYRCFLLLLSPGSTWMPERPGSYCRFLSMTCGPTDFLGLPQRILGKNQIRPKINRIAYQQTSQFLRHATLHFSSCTQALSPQVA